MKLKVITPGKMIIVKGKPIRTPAVVGPLDETGLEFFEAVCRAQSLEYEIIDDTDKSDDKPVMIADDIDDNEPVIEELKTGRLLDELTK